jgi:hypothetical protein
LSGFAPGIAGCSVASLQNWKSKPTTTKKATKAVKKADEHETEEQTEKAQTVKKGKKRGRKPGTKVTKADKSSFDEFVRDYWAARKDEMGLEKQAAMDIRQGSQKIYRSRSRLFFIIA